MTPDEQCLHWNCHGQQLIGILGVPTRPARDIGVVIVVGGPQYRVGSHRQFTLLARRIAVEGYPTLRFDSRGMGDSGGDWQGFENQGDDIASAIDAFQRACPGLGHIVLLGLCDGASAALIYQQDHADPRLIGLALLNPWVRSEQSLARTQVKHYYLRRLSDPAFWRKLMSGRVALGAALEFVKNLTRSRVKARAPVTAFQQRMAQGWASFRGSILLLLSGDDYTAKEFIEYSSTDEQWQKALHRVSPLRHDLEDANHTFASSAWRGWVEQTTLDWLSALEAPTPETGGDDV